MLAILDAQFLDRVQISLPPRCQNGSEVSMAMKWFWRLVCAPDCTDSCQVNCPGCHAMADEWKEQGYVTPATEGTLPPPRWRDFRHAVSCWSRSASARMLARLDPRRIWRRGEVATVDVAGCGCHAPSAAAAGVAGATGLAINLPGTGPEDPIRGEVRQYYDLRAR